MSIDELKRQAAEKAVQQVQPGMVLGLGSGSTALLALRRLGELSQAGRLPGIRGVPTSDAVALEAKRLGIPLTTLEADPVLELTIDGADEVDPRLDVIKGGGGALLKEKIVAQASQRLLIVVDGSKLSPALGTKHALPVEVVPFGWRTQEDYLRSLGAEVTLRKGKDGTPFLTDQGNYILDCRFPPLGAPATLADQLDGRAGIVEHGLFLGLATEVYAATPEGLRHLRRQ